MSLELIARAAGPLLDIATTVAALIAGVCLVLVAVDLCSRLRRFEGRVLTVRVADAGGSTEPFFMALHGLRRSALHRLREGQPWIGLELRGGRGGIESALWLPKGQEAFVTGLLRGVYPDATFAAADAPRRRAHVVMGEFALARGNYLPLRTVFNEEPLAALVATLARGSSDVRLQVLVRPRSSRWQMAAYGEAQRLREPRASGWWPRSAEAPAPRASAFERQRARAIESKATGLGFDCVVRVIAATDTAVDARSAVRAVAASILPLSDANALALRSLRAGGATRVYLERFPLRGPILLTAKELAALWHAPDDALITRLRSAAISVPSAVKGERVLGRSPEGRTVGISLADSRSHLHVLGSTGTGKSTLLLNLATQDIVAGPGIAVLDPKGDLVRALLERIPKARIGQVVLISPDDGTRSLGINPLQLWSGDDRDLVAENALTIFKRIYERYWGPRTDDVLRSALLTVLRRDGTTLAHVPLLLTSEKYRAFVTADLDDPLGLEAFWSWFDELSDGQRREAIGPVLNKLRDFLVRPRLRRLLCQPRSTVDLRAVVDDRKILLADLSVGRWGESSAALIGSFLVARIWQAVLARSARAESERADFFLFLDEFQHFLGIAGPFADALAEARSLGLSLTLANQHLGQLTRELREAVASNARSRIAFQCGQDDAAYLAREFAPLDAGALMSLERFEAAARLVVGGRTCGPLRLNTQAPPPAIGSALDVAAASSATYGRPVAEIDAALIASVPGGALPAAMKGGARARTRASAGASEVDPQVDDRLIPINPDQPDSRGNVPRSLRTTPPEDPKPA